MPFEFEGGFHLPPLGSVLPGANNFIRNIIFHPCSRPWFVYFELAIPALVKAIATVRFIDLEDIMRERAKEFAETGHLRTGRGVRHSLRGLLDDDAGERHHWTRKGLAWMLAATEPLEYAGFAMLLLFAADRFWYDWQALLLAWRYCEGDPNSGPFQFAKRTPGIFVGAYTMDTLLQNRSGWTHTPVDVNVPPGVLTAILSLNITYNGAGTTTNYVYLRANISGVFVEKRSEEITLSAGQSGDMLVQAEWTFPFGGSIAWGFGGTAVPTGFETNGGQITVIKSQF